MSASVGWAQGSICNPCVDPPIRPSILPGLPPLPTAQDLRTIDPAYRTDTPMTLIDSRRMVQRLLQLRQAVLDQSTSSATDNSDDAGSDTIAEESTEQSENTNDDDGVE